MIFEAGMLALNCCVPSPNHKLHLGGESSPTWESDPNCTGETSQELHKALFTGPPEGQEEGLFQSRLREVPWIRSAAP